MIDFPGLSEYLEYIKADYTKFAQTIDASHRQEFIDRFNEGLEFEVGKKYIKVISRRATHSFICLENMGKFSKGDILKADSWASPAKNFSRGNTIAQKYGITISWTGA